MSTVVKSLSDNALASYLAQQLNNMFPDEKLVPVSALKSIIPEVLKRIDYCFSHINNKYFFDGQNTIFNHLHGDQYSMFLYLASNLSFKAGLDTDISSKIFLLNKSLHGIDAFYEVELPPVFLFVHPLGTVLGRAKYGNFFMVYQNCGVGSNHDIYPEFGDFVTMRPGSFVLGECKIGRNCTIAAKSLVLDHELENNCVYIGKPRDFFIRKTDNILPLWRV